jgi:O-antigen ligase
MSKRIAYLISGVLALYIAAAPVLSHLPNARPLWIGVVLWVGATCLVFATITIPGKWREVAAIVGSGLILAVFCYDTLIFPVARKLGYVHITYRLVALQTTWFDRWRLFLDRPLWLMLMVSSIASLTISILSLHAQSRPGR